MINIFKRILNELPLIDPHGLNRRYINNDLMKRFIKSPKFRDVIFNPGVISLWVSINIMFITIIN